MTTPSALSIAEIRRRLTATSVGRQLYLFGEVDSTNAKLRSLANSGAHEGTVVLAEGQTGGRGRRGQEWFSPSGVNLYVSVLFRPTLPPRSVPIFSFIASLALAECVKDLGAHPGIKWPNDVLVEGKKIGGALAECAMRDGEIDYVILGVGVNLNVDLDVLHAALGPSGVFATSLAACTGRTIDRNAFASAYLSRLDAWVTSYHDRGPDVVLDAWRQYDVVTGRRIEARGSQGTFEGRALGVDPNGNLVARDSVGQRHTLTADEVRILD